MTTAVPPPQYSGLRAPFVFLCYLLILGAYATFAHHPAGQIDSFATSARDLLKFIPSDPGSFITGAMNIADKGWISPENNWIISFWPPGFLLIEAGLIKLVGLDMPYFVYLVQILACAAWALVHGIFAGSWWENRYGTVTIPGTRPEQVTTYRSESAYGDRRRPDEVAFHGSLTDDLARRDFTINAIAWLPEAPGATSGRLVDPAGGLDDLRAGLLRAVGDAYERLHEDALRILRAVRFSQRFGFAIEPATEAALAQAAPLVASLSAERVRDELMRLRRGLRAYVDFGLAHPHHYFLTFMLPRGIQDLGEVRYSHDTLGLQAFEHLRDGVAECIASGVLRRGDVDVMSQALWAAVHGITSLLISKPAFPWVDRDTVVDRLIDAPRSRSRRAYVRPNCAWCNGDALLRSRGLTSTRRASRSGFGQKYSRSADSCHKARYRALPWS